MDDSVSETYTEVVELKIAEEVVLDVGKGGDEAWIGVPDVPAVPQEAETLSPQPPGNMVGSSSWLLVWVPDQAAVADTFTGGNVGPPTREPLPDGKGGRRTIEVESAVDSVWLALNKVVHSMVMLRLGESTGDVVKFADDAPAVPWSEGPPCVVSFPAGKGGRSVGDGTMSDEGKPVTETSDWVVRRTVGLIRPVPECATSDPVTLRGGLVAGGWVAEVVKFWT